MTALARRLADLTARHGGSTDELVAGLDRSRRVLATIREGFAAAFGEELPHVTVVVAGSMARGQCTHGSDIDFFTVVDGDGLPAETSAKINEVVLEHARRHGFGPPTAAGPAARTVPRRELETINIFTDDFARSLRRTALVTASTSVHGEPLRAEILMRVLDGFVGRDRTPRVRGVVDQLVRLLRTSNMVADLVFTDTAKENGLVHWAKVSTLYRFEVASCLAAVFQAEQACAGRSRSELLDDLFRRFSRTSSERLLDLYDELAEHERGAVATTFFVADGAMRLFGTPGARERLAARRDDPETRQLHGEFERLVEQLEGALFELFYRTALLGPLTNRLALFG